MSVTIHWITAVSVELFSIFFILIPCWFRRKKISNLYIEPKSLTGFSVMIAGLAISLLLVSKDIAFEDSIEPNIRPYLVMMLVSSFVALISGFGVSGYIDSYPAGRFKDNTETLDYLVEKSGLIFDPKENRFELPYIEGDKQEKILAEYSQYVNQLYRSLIASRQQSGEALFLIMNSTAAFAISAIAQLFVAALVVIF